MAAFIGASNHDKFERIVDTLVKNGVIEHEITWAMWKSNSGGHMNVVFLGREADILTKLRSIVRVEKKTMPTPTSVLVKSAALRFKKLHDVIAEQNEASRTWARQANQTYHPIKDLELKDVDDKFSAYWVSKEVRGAMKFFIRPDVTPEIIKAGWDLYGVYVVMKT